MDQGGASLTSFTNYLKNFEQINGSVHFDAGNAYSNLLTINHGLGYVPANDIWFIPEGVSDKLVPLFLGGPDSYDAWLTEFNAYRGRIRMSDQDIIIEMFRDAFDPYYAIDIPVYIIIYLDEVSV